jgi:hypothetical protein
MKKESQEILPTPHLNIEKLLRTLEALSKETNRISRARLDEIFRALRFELPYSTPIINAGLAFALFADSPRNSADTTLNEAVIHLSKTLINPMQTAALTQAIQTYYQERKKTESEYAADTVQTVVAANPLDAFPEASWEAMRELALTVMDKIVSEKLARRIPGYKSQSVLELINPFLHFRLANATLEKIKMAQPQVFKKWLTNLAHDGYEKINNEKKFTLIQQEKENAFAALKTFLTSKSQNKANLTRYIERIAFSQKDKNKKFDSLNKKLDEMLPEQAIISESAGLLRMRFYDNLRKLFALAERNPAVYQQEDSITKAQNKAYSQIKNDLAAIKKILDIFTELNKNSSKNLMASLLTRGNINQIKVILATGLLGPIVKKRDLHNGNYIMVHDGGYPQKNLNAITSNLITGLQNLADNVTGMFSAALKIQIEQAIQQLTALGSNLAPDEQWVAPVEATAEAPPIETSTEPVTAPRMEIPYASPSVEKTFGPIPKSRFEIPEPAVKPEPVIEPAQTLVAPAIPEETLEVSTASTVEEAAEIPQTLDEFMETPTVSDPIDEFAETPAAPESTNEAAETPAAPETINDTAETPAEEPINKLAESPAPEPSIEPAEKPELAPEPTDTPTAPAPMNAAPTEPASEANTEEVSSEPVFPSIEFDDEEIPTIQFEPVTFEAPAPAQPVVSDPGLVIMSNYELGDFKEPVHEAWKTMLVQAVSARPDVADINIIADEQAVNFYVICDLVQQVVSINEDMLSPDNKEMLISIQTLLLAALKDPLEENNWTFFEGSRRNDVDRAIAVLKS